MNRTSFPYELTDEDYLTIRKWKWGFAALYGAIWRRRVRIRNELITLNDGDLRDIGWTRAEVEAERRKPFWRA